MASKKYDDLTKDELVRLLESRDRRDATKFGLVWEANEIDRDKALNQEFVAIELDGAASVPHSGPWKNLIIEGDNFDALRYLRMALAGRVKCIYIDPPYNTGNRDFVYNDQFVDKNDLWRHSKWCEFMFQRLTLARDLLADDGVMFINIGEDEVHNLGCLLNSVMPGRKVATFVWRTRSGANDSKEYFRSIDHEYVFCYANPGFTFAGSTKGQSSFSNPDNDPAGPWSNDNLVTNKNYRQRANAFYPIYNELSDVWYPCDPDNTWRFASEAKIKPGQKIRTKPIEQLIRENKVIWPNDKRSVRYDTIEDLREGIQTGVAPRNLRIGDTPEEIEFWGKELAFWVGKTIGYGKPRYKRHLSEVRRSEKPFSSWLAPSATKKDELLLLAAEDVETLVVGSTSEGTSLVQEMIGNKDFPYPKPLSLVQGLIKQVTGPGDIIVDFFAGSGTTAHAVLALNDEDSADRRFILVSNSEATLSEPDKNVCRDVTRKRVSKAIDGYSVVTKTGPKAIEGLGGNFAYFRCRRLPPGKMLDIDHSQVWTALQLTHVDRISEFAGEPVTTAGDDEQLVIYLPQFRAKHFGALRKSVESSRAVIVYSWQPESIRLRLKDYVHVQVEAIPESLARRFGIRI